MTTGNGDAKTEKATVTPRQRRAIETLLKTGSPTRAAETAGVIRQTVHKWMHRPAFAAALAEAEAEALADLARNLVTLGAKATVTLYEAMDYDKRSPASRVTAANAVLTHLLKLREMATLEDRVKALEAAILEGKK